LKKIFRFLSSLKLAVVVLLSLALSLATATFVESLYDTRTAQYWVYRSWWFEGLLSFLAINIFSVAMSRLPWKPKHTPFLLAHLGILTLLTGSFLTQKYGLDGSLRIAEGETTNVVELENAGLVLIDGTSAVRVPVPWIPPNVEFKKFRLKDKGLLYDLTVDRYLSHADPTYQFIEDPQTKSMPQPAIKVRLQGGRMAISQTYWLWAGDPQWRSVQAGPATLIFSTGAHQMEGPKGRPSLVISSDSTGAVQYVATSSEGKKVSGTFSGGKVAGQEINPGWRGDVKLIFDQWLPRAIPMTTYAPSRIQRGPQAPPSAIHLISGNGGEGSELWLGLGERAVLEMKGNEVQLGYLPEMVILPFQVKLDHFTIDRYDGTRDPSSYASEVTVLDQAGSASSRISMNEPLLHMGTTLYQASYEDAMPRPTVSIFSVNRDPGRWLKYIGSILIVSGSILLFAMKYRQKKTTEPAKRATLEGAAL
jgi:hypothetical protein